MTPWPIPDHRCQPECFCADAACPVCYLATCEDPEACLAVEFCEGCETPITGAVVRDGSIAFCVPCWEQDCTPMLRALAAIVRARGSRFVIVPGAMATAMAMASGDEAEA